MRLKKKVSDQRNGKIKKLISRKVLIFLPLNK
jgi:hypothetical protein